MSIHFQYKVLQFSLYYIPTCDDMILNTEEEYIKTAPSHKWKFSTSVHLKKVMIRQQDNVPIWHIANKMVMGITKNKNISQF